MKNSTTFHFEMNGIKTAVLLLLVSFFLPATAQLVVDAGPDQTICFGSFVTLGGNPTASGGSGPVIYNWTPSAGLSSTNIANPIAAPQTTTTYSLIVTDSVGYADSSQVTIFVSPAITLSLSPNNIVCNGVNNGSICATVFGGNAPYTYLWSNGSSVPCISNLSAGPYSITVVDANGCSASAQFTITQPAPITVSITNSGNGIAPDTLAALASGGTPPYTFLWSQGATAQSEVVTNYGNYSVTVTDINGCTGSASYVFGGAITVTYPNGGENLVVNQPVTITWTSQGNVSGFVKIEAYSSIAFNWITLAASVPDNGTYNFVVPNAPGSQGKIRISDVSNTSVLDESDALFNIVAAGSLTIDSFTVNDVSCFGLSDGEVVVHASGGTLPYQYSKDGGITFQTTNVLTNLPIGSYTILVKDANNVQVSGNVNVLQNSALLIDSIVVNDVSCLDGQNGSACVYASGGSGIYFYNWSPPGIGASCNITMQAGNYLLTVTDDAGCSTTSTVTVNEPSTAVSLNIISETTDGAPDTLTVSPTGGEEPYIVYWQNATNQFVGEGDTVSNVFYSNSIYNIVCYDSLGCLATYVFNNTNFPDNCNIDTLFANVLDTFCFPAGIIDSISVLTAPLHGQISFFGSTCASYASNSNYSGDEFFELRIYALGGIAIDTQSYCFYIRPNCTDQCVWPGDANYDGVVDNNDLLPVGLAYGANGSPRAQQNINWYAHTATDWADTLSDGTNYKHIDCNGSGLINSDDTLAILQNFALTHPRSGMPEPRGNVPALQIEMAPDTLIDGTTVVANLVLGDANFSANNVYGLAFTFNFDPAVVDSTDYGIVFSNSSWLCNSSTDHIDIDKKLFSQGQIKAAITRIDHTSRSGAGEIGSVSMKITTGNINGKNLSYYTMHTYISDVVMLDQNGTPMLVDAGADSANVEFEPVGLNNPAEERLQFSLTPNPAVDALSISTKETSVESVLVFNKMGEVMSVPVIRKSDTNLQLDISGLSAGLYFVHLKSLEGSGVERFVKLR